MFFLHTNACRSHSSPRKWSGGVTVGVRARWDHQGAEKARSDWPGTQGLGGGQKNTGGGNQSEKTHHLLFVSDPGMSVMLGLNSDKRASKLNTQHLLKCTFICSLRANCDCFFSCDSRPASCTSAQPKWPRMRWVDTKSGSITSSVWSPLISFHFLTSAQTFQLFTLSLEQAPNWTVPVSACKKLLWRFSHAMILFLHVTHVLVSRAGNRPADNGTGEKGVQKDQRTGEGAGAGQREGRHGEDSDGEEAARGRLQGNFPQVEVILCGLQGEMFVPSLTSHKSVFPLWERNHNFGNN